MSQEAAPDQEASTEPGKERSAPGALPGQEPRRKGLLEQMEELMAALDADLSRLDADLQSGDRPDLRSGDRPAPGARGD